MAWKIDVNHHENMSTRRAIYLSKGAMGVRSFIGYAARRW